MIGIALIASSYGIWPMWGTGPAHEAVQVMAGAHASGPTLKWFHQVNDQTQWLFSATADVDGDGSNEVIAGNFNGYVYCLAGSTGTVKWSFDAGGGAGGLDVETSPAVADFDGNGIMEVIIGTWGAGSGHLYSISGAGGALNWDKNTGGQYHAGPTIADVDGDGKLEVIANNRSTLYSVDGLTGAIEWSAPLGGPVASENSSPAVGDVDGDGQMEVIVGTMDSLRCFDGLTGAQEWAYSGGFDYPNSSPAIADCDGDGALEIIVGCDQGALVCISGTGTLKWSANTGAAIWSQPVVVDADLDGIKDVIVGTFAGVVCMDATSGNLKWQNNIGDIRAGIPVCDVDGDGEYEVVTGLSGSSDILCLNAEDGGLLWQITSPASDVSLYIADVDRDGCVEIVGGSASGEGGVMVFDDPANSSGCGPTGNDESENNSPFPRIVAKGQGIYLFMPQPAQVSLRLYDAQGRLVQNLYDGILSQGGHTFSPELGASGVYMAVLRCQDKTLTAKVIR